MADLHVPIRPGTDALLLLALLQVIFAERLARPGRLAAFADGLGAIEELVTHFTPEAVAAATGVPSAVTARWRASSRPPSRPWPTAAWASPCRSSAGWRAG